MRHIRRITLLASTVSLLAGAVPSGHAQAAESLPFDVKRLTSFYSPQPDLTNLDNWQTYNAYNTVHFVAEQLPNRQPNDQTTNDPLGDPNPRCKLLGDTAPAAANNPNCTYNHQLEYLDWREEAYRKVLGDFGVTFRRFEFTSPGGSAPFATNAGRAFNQFAIVPGADHPEDFVLIGGHYDGVDGSPYAAWDSTSGTGTMLRTAKLLADYWKATGTRPSKTVIFAAWDGEEAGTSGSKQFVGTQSNKTSQTGYLPKDPEVVVTSYINHDPCGGHYPAFYRGSPVSRNPYAEKSGFIPMNVALHAPAGTAAERARMTQFNDSVRPMINLLFNNLDDTLRYTTQGEEPGVIPVFLSKDEANDFGAAGAPLEQESVLKVHTNALIGFSTDAEAFHNWIPTLNPYPDVLPRSSNPPGQFSSADAFFAYHTPHDNFEMLVAQTHADPTGLSYSKGLAMSFELCAMLAAATMLQPTQGGSQTVDPNPVAWFDATNPNVNGGTKVFNATGSYRYTDPASRSLDDTLEYEWDFGDGTTATGPTVTHTFPAAKGYRVTLTVRDPETGTTDTMTQKVGVGAI